MRSYTGLAVCGGAERGKPLCRFLLQSPDCWFHEDKCYHRAFQSYLQTNTAQHTSSHRICWKPACEGWPYIFIKLSQFTGPGTTFLWVGPFALQAQWVVCLIEDHSGKRTMSPISPSNGHAYNYDYRRKHAMSKKCKKLIHITAMALLQSAIPQVVICFTLMTHVPAWPIRSSICSNGLVLTLI